MKLLTQLTASRDGSLVDATDENLIHDAACAHALLQAKNEFLANAFYHDLRTLIDIRADEIMREWGFDSGEAE